MRAFRYEQVPVRVVFAAGALKDAATEAETLGARRVLLIADDAAEAAADVVAAGLGDRLVGRIGKVIQHVPVEAATTATEMARTADADLLISVGGGSATGLAKAVARHLPIPILAVPTTFAGSEMTPIWGLTEAGRKTTGRDPRVQPRVVVYDPVLTVTMPADLTATSGMNALAHCVEALYAPDVTPVISLAAAEGVRVLAAGLPRCVENPDSVEARAEALYGAWLAGWSLGATTMGLHHKLCHVLGGMYDLPHAPTHSAVLPYAIAYSRDAAPGPLGRVADALGAGDAAGGLWDLARRLGVETSLAAVGMPPDGVDAVLDAVIANPPINPRPVEREALRSLLRSALTGDRP
jgi:maleylacetate reductase